MRPAAAAGQPMRAGKEAATGTESSFKRFVAKSRILVQKRTNPKINAPAADLRLNKHLPLFPEMHSLKEKRPVLLALKLCSP